MLHKLPGQIRHPLLCCLNRLTVRQATLAERSRFQEDPVENV